MDAMRRLLGTGGARRLACGVAPLLTVRRIAACVPRCAWQPTAPAATLAPMHKLCPRPRWTRATGCRYWIDAVCDTYVQLDCDTPRRDGSLRRRDRGRPARDARAVARHRRPRSGCGARRPRSPARARTTSWSASRPQGRGMRLAGRPRRGAAARATSRSTTATRPYELHLRRRRSSSIVLHAARADAAHRAARHREADRARRSRGDRGAGHLMIEHDPHARRRHRHAGARLGRRGRRQRRAHPGRRACARCPGAPARRCRSSPRSTASRSRRSCASACATRAFASPQIAARLRTVAEHDASRLRGRGRARSPTGSGRSGSSGARRDLCDPALAARTISEIAFGWGFNDAAHFSRAFRARFGAAPRELRALAFPTSH